LQRSIQIVVPGADFAVPHGAPRGTYRVHPITGGLPPTARAPFEVAVGKPVPPPEFMTVALVGKTAIATGRNLTETTWMEVVGPQGAVHRVLPTLRDDGTLVIDVSGVDLPKVPIRVRLHNLSPGGGPGPYFILDPS
jgi:hypothetical protein